MTQDPSSLRPPFLPAGKFSIGANYWASHAGTSMWSEWRPDIVEQDFQKLSGAGLKVLRVFPLWPDFQPISGLRRECGHRVEYRHGETHLPDDPIGQSGVSAMMLERLAFLCDLAARYDLGLIVGLVTGWMSGRLFVPPALEGLDPLTDPLSIMWQVRLASTVVRELRDHPAIRAWDLGNECNCMGHASREKAWLWTATLANAIRSADASRPVVSGMHGLSVDPRGDWNIRDQGELTDLLTTHPYPLFTPHCNREPMNTLRPLLHGTAETRLYADLSARPAFVEETGNFGPAFCGEQVAVDIIRAQLFSLWAHDCRAALWWCAHDQTELEGAPYDWVSMERELGLLRPDGSAKPMLAEMSRVQGLIDQMPGSLPPRRIDAVCLLTNDQDQWGAAYTAFILAKQAGFDVSFSHGDRPLPEACLYILPSICNLRALSRQQEAALLARVRDGATLYVSMDDGFLGVVMKMTGLEVIGRRQRLAPCSFRLGEEDFTIDSSTQYDLKPGAATVLAGENGTPVFSVATCGQGKVYFLSVPLETQLAQTNGAFLESGRPFWKIYEVFARDALATRHVRKTSPALGITEHASADGTLVVVLINYQPAPVRDSLSFSGNYVFAGSLVGDPLSVAEGKASVVLRPNETAVWRFQRVEPNRIDHRER